MAKRFRTAAERAEQMSRLRTRPARARMLAAAHELATARGYESIKAGDIAEAAGVSRETFYTHFADKRSCLAEATDPRMGEIESELRIAGEEEEPWAAPLLASLEAALHDRYGSGSTPRGRIIEAMLSVAAERGYSSTRLVDVIKAAHASYPSFYRHFAGKAECFAVACDGLIASLASQLEATEARRGLEGADPGIRAIALAELLADDHVTARILAVEADQLPREGGAATHGPAASLGRLLVPEAADPTDQGHHGQSGVLLAGAFLELLRNRVLEGRLDRLPADVAALAPHLAAPAGDPAQRVDHSAPLPRRRQIRPGRGRRPFPVPAGTP